MIYAFAISLGLGALASTILGITLKIVRGELLYERAAHNETKANLLATQAAVEIAESGRKNDVNRLEAVIRQANAEIADLEAVESLDPEAMRKKLEKLTGG